MVNKACRKSIWAVTWQNSVSWCLGTSKKSGREAIWDRSTGSVYRTPLRTCKIFIVIQQKFLLPTIYTLTVGLYCTESQKHCLKVFVNFCLQFYEGFIFGFKNFASRKTAFLDFFFTFHGPHSKVRVHALPRVCWRSTTWVWRGGGGGSSFF